MDDAASMEDSVRQSISALTLQPQDTALTDLAIRYAVMVDTYPDLILKVGPALLATLEALLMTPRARAALLKGVPDDRPKSAATALDDLRARRAKRA